MSHSQPIDYTQNVSQLYHISEDGRIACFEPRPVRADHPLQHLGPVVWAIGERLLHNYLLPRDCPRVTFYAGPHTTAADAERFLGATTARHVVAIEANWLPSLRTTRLYRYTLPAIPFTLVDPIADYWVSSTAVAPLAVEPVDDLLQALTTRDVELWVMPSLWPPRDAVVTSTLAFSCIRMANAQRR